MTGDSLTTLTAAMAATADDRPLDVPAPELRRIDSAVARRLVGAVLLSVIVSLFFVAVDQSRLDTMRGDIAAATSGGAAGFASAVDSSNCFQGFCFEEDAGFLETWWEFSATYLRLVWPVLLLAFVVAGIVDAFLFPTRAGPAYGTWETSGVGSRVAAAGTSLIPARGRPDVPTALLVGALGTPALAMTVVLLTPAAWTTRLGLAMVVSAPLLLIPRWAAPAFRHAPVGSAWDEIRGAVRSAGVSSWRFGLRLAPLFVVAGAGGAFATRYLTVDGVEAVVGRHLVGVVLGASVGLLLTLPLTFGLPIAAFGLLIGVDPVVAGVFLVTATLGGLTTLLRVPSLPARQRAAVVAAVVLALAGSMGMLGAAAVARAITGGPSVAWDGERCVYAGPGRIDSGLHEITMRNDDGEAGSGRTLAVVVGRLPPNVSLDHFTATVAADPTGLLPDWFEVAATDEFVFAGTEHDAAIALTEPGRYTAVCVESTPQTRTESVFHPAEQVFVVVSD